MHLVTTVRQPAAARLPFGRAPATCSLLQTVKPWFCGSLMSVLDQLATGPNLSIFSEKRVSYSLLGSETEKKIKEKRRRKNIRGKQSGADQCFSCRKKGFSNLQCLAESSSMQLLLILQCFDRKSGCPKRTQQSVSSKQALLLPHTRLPLFLGSPFLAVYLANEWVFLRLSILQKYFSFYVHMYYMYVVLRT